MVHPSIFYIPFYDYYYLFFLIIFPFSERSFTIVRRDVFAMFIEFPMKVLFRSFIFFLMPVISSVITAKINCHVTKRIQLSLQNTLDTTYNKSTVQLHLHARA